MLNGSPYSMDIATLSGALDTWETTVANTVKARANIRQVLDE
jgi:hypothetical protein